MSEYVYIFIESFSSRSFFMHTFMLVLQIDIFSGGSFSLMKAYTYGCHFGPFDARIAYTGNVPFLLSTKIPHIDCDERKTKPSQLRKRANKMQ